MTKNVLLFKGKETNTPLDEYEYELEHYNYKTDFIPVLDSKPESISFIQELLVQPPGHGGIIFTSQRSVDSWNQAITTLQQKQRQEQQRESIIHPQWHLLNVFIVGTKTAEKLSNLSFFHNEPIVHDRAVQLAPEMIPVMLNKKKQDPHFQNSILFLAGDKRLNELPTRLKEADIPFQEVRTYSTCAHPELTDRLVSKHQQRQHQHQQKDNGDNEEDWAVFFSPSGVNYVLERNIQWIKSIPKLAAIGATTADHMKQCGLTVTLISPKPRAKDLAAAIAVHDGSSDQ
ncbi:tetrapyrrole biosynthesis, uroporphyrinogen III synthase [Phascolomyces articulosus]|uniref:Tetrapyrrole biosynthesis, uroporphyrinogen III synthase n=1 Tax=Phascolomyces articulosus TaxID=60185 RepID=A0AAD5JX09_9FUNG|nr:tetrapyrrole biosynthesis, uroporphyrinogen III synthase [Phascolomyces articulosus]